jgi:LysR family transcriptional regulator, regulator for bpeEF and oprC
MHGLQQFLAFAETAKHGSFAAAARELGGAPSSPAKAVARLEGALGVKLFHRTTRQVSLTPDGERLFARCQRVLAEVEDLHAEASDTRALPAGTLRIDLPIVYGKRFVLPLLAELVRKHPALQLDLRLSDAYVDLVRDGIDLALRVGPLQDSSLVARRIDRQGMVLCASPKYLAAAGTPRRLEDLASHAAVVFRLPTSGRNRPWSFRQRGMPLDIQPTSRVRVSDGEGLIEALKLGLGLGQIPDYMVESELARGQLVEVLGSCRPEPLPINVVYPSGRLLPARVRAAIDALLLVSRRRAEPPAPQPTRARRP